MGIKLSEIGQKTRRTVRLLDDANGAIKVLENGYRPKKGEDVITVSYTPDRVTAAHQESIAAARAAPVEERMVAIAEALVRVAVITLISWDVLDEDGTPIPITIESVRTVPLTFLDELLGAIFAAEAPSGEASGASEPPSRARASSARSLPGTSSS